MLWFADDLRGHFDEQPESARRLGHSEVVRDEGTKLRTDNSCCGEMHGVDYNRDLAWTGSSIGLWPA